MDLPVWVTLIVAVIAGVGAYFGGVRSAKIGAREQQADRDLERERLAHERLMRQDARLDRAWELCQGPNGQDWQAGVALFAALLAEPDLTLQTRRYIDSLIAIHFRGRARELLSEAEQPGQVTPLDIYVEAGDDGSEEGEPDEQ